jgi:hypothetical protein
MKGFIEGFLKFQRDAFPQRSVLFKRLATSQNASAGQACHVTTTRAARPYQGE